MLPDRCHIAYLIHYQSLEPLHCFRIASSGSWYCGIWLDLEFWKRHNTEKNIGQHPSHVCCSKEERVRMPILMGAR